MQSVSPISREHSLMQKSFKEPNPAIAPLSIVMSNRRLYRVMPESGLCPLFIVWFHLSVSEGKHQEKHNSGTDTALHLMLGCPQTFTAKFLNAEKCTCVCIYTLTQTTAFWAMRNNPPCNMDVFLSSLLLHTWGLLNCKMNMTMLIFQLVPMTVWRGWCLHMQYARWKLPRKYNIIKGKLTSAIPLLAKTLSYLPVLIFQFSYLLCSKSTLAPCLKPGLILHIQVILLNSVSWLKLETKYANVIVGVISVTKIACQCCYSISWYSNSKHYWDVLKLSATSLVGTMLQSGENIEN